MQKKGIFLFIISLFIISTSFAQNGSIKGFVKDKKTGEPMMGANIIVVNGKTGVQTDINGYYSISLSPGEYTVIATALSYDSITLNINLLPGVIVTKNLSLTKQEVELGTHTVSSHRTDKITRTGIGITQFDPAQIKMLPSAGGEPDLAQYLQVIPGVVFTGDQGGQLYIRGGSPVQTGIYLDGITIYNPFHSIGLFSVFETEAIRNVDVYSAGFGAQYGNRTSAVVDVHTKDGNKNEISGIVSVSPIMSRFLLEGPMMKPKKDNGTSISYLVTAKSSYLDQTSKSLYGGLGQTFENGLPYKFTDVYGKITFSGDNGSKLNIFGFSFNDQAKLLNDTSHLEIANYSWKARGVGANFVVSPNNSTALIEAKFAFSNYGINLNEVGTATDTLPRNSSINGFEAAINFTYFLPNYSQLKYGVEVSGFNTTLNYNSFAGISTTENRQSTLAALYFLFRKDFSDKVIFEPSVRCQYYSEINTPTIEPRASIKYNITPNIRLKAATGIYSQNIISTKTDRDIVNLFTGFLLSPDQQIKDANGQPVKTNLQTAYHAVCGLEVDVKNVEFNLEPWIKYFGQIDEFNRNKLYSNDPDFVAASGKAYGVDLSGKYSYDRIYLWGAIGSQIVEYTSLGPNNVIQTYPTPFDTRLNVNLVAAYTAGKNKNWDISTRFNMRSPFPFTQTQGFYENLNMTGNGLATNYLQQNGTLNVLYADQINGGRLSYYHRLDFSVRKKFTFTKKTNLDATFAITNVYNRQNIFYIDRITNVKIYQLPLFPSINLTLNF